MNALTCSQSDANQKIYGLVSTLTSLDPNITEISDPIEKSNILIKNINNEINQLNSKSKLIKLAILTLLEKKLQQTKLEIDSYIQQLHEGKVEAQSICDEYARVISDLNKLTGQLAENSYLKADALGIVSLNNLKLKNIKNQIILAETQIATLDRFNSITIYHLTDMINSNKADKNFPITYEIQRVIKKLKSRKIYFICASFFLVVLTIYNYVASNYFMVVDRVSRAVVNTGIGNINMALPDNSDLTQTVVAVSGLLGAIITAYGGFRCLMSDSDAQSAFSTLTLGLTLSASTPIFLYLFDNPADVQPTKPVYVEKVITETYEFISLGSTGSIALLCLILASLFFIIWLNHRIKKYTIVMKSFNCPSQSLKNINQKNS